MYARPLIDSLDFARNSQESCGEVPLAEMSRLLELLANAQGMLSYTISGNLDNQGSPFLNLSANGSCQLFCQRCLESMDYQVELNTRLLLRKQEDLDALGDEIEEFDSILADVKLDVLNLLEDEVLLSLPIAPKHVPGACQAAIGRNGFAGENHPFETLKKLKRN